MYQYGCKLQSLSLIAPIIKIGSGSIRTVIIPLFSFMLLFDSCPVVL